MKSFVIITILVFIVQSILLVGRVYIVNKPTTVEQLVQYSKRYNWILWTPYIGSCITLIGITIEIKDYLWNKLRFLRIR